MNYVAGKATRAPEMHGVVESQRTERYQAVHLDPPRFNPVRRRSAIATLWPFAAVVAWVVMGAFWPVVPPWLRAVCIASTPIVAVAAVWPMWRRGR